LRAIPAALVIALGTCAADGLAELVAAGALDPARCLIGLPHPSGANGHRHARFARVRDALSGQVAAWFAREHSSRGGVGRLGLDHAPAPCYRTVVLDPHAADD